MRSTYGQKRNYRKIDLFLHGEYICTTTWARTLTEAREAFLQDRQGQEGRLIAHFSTKGAT